MQDLARYAKKETIEIHTRYLSMLIGGFVALVALVFALGLLMGSKRAQPQECPALDPLASLDSKSNEPPVPERPAISLSFHETLSSPSPSHIASRGRLEEAEPSGQAPSSDTGPVRVRGEEPAALEEAQEDEPGVYTLQVGSFQNAEEAGGMVKRLERIGYRAFLVSVNMPDRGGRWYRVRVGPFDTKREAWASKVAFEQKVRIPAFVVKKKTEDSPRDASDLTRPRRAPKRG
jgi:cell division protein FtsN